MATKIKKLEVRQLTNSKVFPNPPLPQRSHIPNCLNLIYQRKRTVPTSATEHGAQLDSAAWISPQRPLRACYPPAGPPCIPRRRDLICISLLARALRQETRHGPQATDRTKTANNTDTGHDTGPRKRPSAHTGPQSARPRKPRKPHEARQNPRTINGPHGAARHERRTKQTTPTRAHATIQDRGLGTGRGTPRTSTGAKARSANEPRPATGGRL